MPRACTICTHAERDAIDRALVEAAPMRRIAAEHSLAETSVRRHAARHLPTTLVLAAEAGDVMRADDRLGEARRLHGEALVAAKASGHLGATLQAIDCAQRSAARGAVRSAARDPRPGAGGAVEGAGGRPVQEVRL